MEKPDGSMVTFTYNCDDWRVQREDGFDTVYYQYDKNNLLAELDGSIVQVQYTNEPNEYGNVVSHYRPGDGESRYYVFDALGSTVALTDDAAGKTDDYMYDAWGDVVAQTGFSENPLQFVGQLGYYRDEDLQRTHVRRREYSDILGRFFSEDPTREAGGDNILYRYVQNDPVNSVDPSGLEELKGSMFQQFSTKACHAPSSQQFCGPLSLSGFGQLAKPAGQTSKPVVRDGILHAEFDPKVKLTQLDIANLVVLGAAHVEERKQPQNGSGSVNLSKQQVAVIRIQLANGNTRQLVYERDTEPAHYYQSDVSQPIQLKNSDTYSYVKDGPVSIKPPQLADTCVFSPQDAGHQQADAAKLEFFVRVIPVVGSLERLNALCRTGQDKPTVANVGGAAISTVGDAFLIGGILCSAKVITSGLINIQVLAKAEAGLQGMNAGLELYNAYNAETNTQKGLHLVGAAASILIARGAIKFSRVDTNTPIQGPKPLTQSGNTILQSGDNVIINPLVNTGGGNRPVTTMDQLLSSNSMPGQTGVFLDQQTVKFADIWRLSVRDGAEYVLTREGGKYVLRSGLGNTVSIPLGVRPIAHTHPPDITGYVDKLPSRADINVLNAFWAKNPNGPRPISQVIISPCETIIFRASGLDMIPKPKPKPGR